MTIPVTPRAAVVAAAVTRRGNRADAEQADQQDCRDGGDRPSKTVKH
jgi:hypothetical protein